VVGGLGREGERDQYCCNSQEWIHGQPDIVSLRLYGLVKIARIRLPTSGVLTVLTLTATVR